MAKVTRLVTVETQYSSGFKVDSNKITYTYIKVKLLLYYYILL